MTDAASTLPVGSVWEITDPAEVQRPDGTTKTVVGGAHVLDQPGKYTAGRKTITAVEKS